MAKSKKESPISSQLIMDFAEGSLDIDRDLSNAVSKSLKKTSKSRYHVAAMMSELAGREITKTMLDHYSGESHEGHRIPGGLIPAFCISTGIYLVMDVLAEHTNGHFATGKDAQYLELAKAEARRDRLDKRIKELKAEIS